MSGIARHSDGGQDGTLGGADLADSENQIVSEIQHGSGMMGGN